MRIPRRGNRRVVTRITLLGMALVLGASAIVGVVGRVMEQVQAATPAYTLGMQTGHPNYFGSYVGALAGTADGGFLIGDSYGGTGIKKFDSTGAYQFSFGDGVSSRLLLGVNSIAVDAAGNAYVATYTTNDTTCTTGPNTWKYCVKKYDASGHYLSTINFTGVPNISSIQSLAIDSRDMLYVKFQYTANGATGVRIDKFDMNGSFVQSIATSQLEGGLLNDRYASTTNMVIAADTLYVPDGLSLQTFGLDGHFITKINPDAVGAVDNKIYGAQQVAVGSDGTIAVIDAGCQSSSRCIKYFTQSGIYVGKTGLSDESSRLTATANGFYVALNVYSYPSSGRVNKVDSQGLNQLVVIGNGGASLASPDAITIDASENIYVYDRYNYRVQKFNRNGELLLTIPFKNPYSGQCTGLVVDATGNVYIVTRTTDYNCHIQKFSPTGSFLSQSGAMSSAYENNLVTDGSGHLYTSAYATAGNSFGAFIVVYDMDGNFIKTINDYGNGAPRYGTSVSSLAYYAGMLYVLDTDGIYKFALDGSSATRFVDLTNRSTSGLAVDGHGNVLTVAQLSQYSSQYRIHKYSPTGTLLTSFDSPIVNSARLAVDNQESIFVLGNKYDNYTSVSTNTVSRYDASFIYSPSSAPINITTSNITKNTATVAWDALGGTASSPVTQYKIRVREVGANADAYTADNLSATTANVTGLTASTDYQVFVSAGNIDGYGPEAAADFRTQNGPPKVINEVAFSEVAGKKLLTVTGTGMIDNDNNEYFNALDHGLVTLNGTPLPFCSQYGFGMTAQQLIDIYSAYYPNLPHTVSDNPPCYRLLDIATYSPLITETQAIVELPDGFDTAAEGTVLVNGSSTYTFNRPLDAPAVMYVDGTKPIGEHPVVPERPIFSGTATPHAHVVVTVHSDPVVCETTADASGNWSCTLPANLPAGEHTVYVQVTNPDATVENLGPYAVTVAQGGGVVTNKTPTAPNTGSKSAWLHYGGAMVVVAGVLGIAAVSLGVLMRLRRASLKVARARIEKLEQREP